MTGCLQPAANVVRPARAGQAGLGIGYGGIDLITSTGKAIAGTAKFVGRGILQVALRARWMTADREHIRPLMEMAGDHAAEQAP